MLIKANSLLYAVYVCLIVAIICSGLLYFSGLYTMLNLYYNTREALYVQNDSAVNYFLADVNNGSEELITDGIVSYVAYKNFGLIKVATVRSFYHNDTISSSHFIGSYPSESKSIHLAEFSSPISYSGTVTLIGDKVLPGGIISERYIRNVPNILNSKGKVTSASDMLPPIRSDFETGLPTVSSTSVNFAAIEPNPQGIYINSFDKPTLKLTTGYTIGVKGIKGNFIITAKDSLAIDRTLIMEDVIISAPVVRIKRGFSGSVQVYASSKVIVEDEVELKYPSSVVVYNPSDNKATISLGVNSTVYGALVLFGNPIKRLEQNNIRLSQKSLVVGEVYATGKVIAGGSIYGTVYAYGLSGQNSQSIYENCLIDTTIDVSLRPDYFVSIPLFNEKKVSFEPIKKVF